MEKSGILLVVTATALLALTTGARPPLFPGKCTCNNRWLPSNCSEVDPAVYPSHDHVFSSTDCLPEVEVNHRVCYMTKVKECPEADGSVYYGCSLREGGHKMGLRLWPLFSTEVNESKVYFDSVHDRMARNGVCFYNISVSADQSARNCSGIVLESAIGNDVYELPAVESSNTTSGSSCKSYLRVYYTTKGGQEGDRIVCLKDLSVFYASIPDITSVFVVYWTNNDASNAGSSFRMRARCMN